MLFKKEKREQGRVFLLGGRMKGSGQETKRRGERVRGRNKSSATARDERNGRGTGRDWRKREEKEHQD